MSEPRGDNRLNGPCCRGTPTGPCGDPQTQPYAGGALCRTHSPWALAGQPEPITPTEIARRKEQQ